jgi:hypothetical protein
LGEKKEEEEVKEKLDLEKFREQKLEDGQENLDFPSRRKSII